MIPPTSGVRLNTAASAATDLTAYQRDTVWKTSSGAILRQNAKVGLHDYQKCCALHM